MSLNFDKWLELKKQSKVQNDVIKMDNLINFLNIIKEILFPGFDYLFDSIDEYLNKQITNGKKTLADLLDNVEKIEEVKLNKNEIIESFFEAIPGIDELLKKDIEALYEGDPAADSETEIILCYPGFTAIYVYRIAHVLYNLGVPILPRALAEYAHSKTGIDIHPGAQIGAYFFIDHGTGIVIGQTTIIGEHVKLYQGVTLGALSLREGHKLKGSKRHPTIEDYVTIYSGASIFGGDTIIGKNSTIGSNAYITSSVEENMVVTIQGQKKKHI